METLPRPSVSRRVHVAGVLLLLAACMTSCLTADSTIKIGRAHV